MEKILGLPNGSVEPDQVVTFVVELEAVLFEPVSDKIDALIPWLAIAVGFFSIETATFENGGYEAIISLNGEDDGEANAIFPREELAGHVPRSRHPDLFEDFSSPETGRGQHQAVAS